MDTFRFPSKTFLLGEYAILKGSNALLLGHGPYFTATHEHASAPDAHFHPDSLAGLWWKQNPFDLKVRLQDPHEGRGGFGGSGAEFLACWVAEKSIPAPDAPRAIFAWSAWEDSRTLPNAGSGADILSQAFGCNRHEEEPFFLEIDLEGRSLNEIFVRRKQGGMLSLFHTGQKLATHGHAIPENLPIAELEDIVLRAGTHLESGLFDGFARAVAEYGAKLEELGLVAPHTLKALSGAREIPGVLAAKGCGAMGADVILVVHNEEAGLEPWARENSLTLTLKFPV